MKKIYSTIIIVLALSTSCDDKLDLTPKQQIPTEDVLTSSENVISVLNGAYSGIKGTFGNNEGGELYGGDFNYFSELLADNGDVRWVGSFEELEQLINKSILTNNARVRDSWLRSYEVINMCNIILKYINVVDEDERDRVKGETLAIRGLVYFDLVRLWGKPWIAGSPNNAPEQGVPLIVSPTLTEDDAKGVKRNTVAEVYALVIEDLNNAKSLLEEFEKNGNGLSTYGVSAILSRVFLQQGEYEKAAIEANRVIESGIYDLTDSPLKAFNNNSNSTEDIFAIQQSALSNSGTNNSGLATHYAGLYGSGRADIEILDQHIEKYEEGDLRGGIDESLVRTSSISNVSKMFYLGVNDQQFGNIQTSKWGDPKLNIPVLRLSEMYLTRAEGNFEAGTTHGASPVEDINTIRHRARLEELESVNRENIRKERVLELAWEGHRLHDIKRWQQSVGELNFDANELILPIPEREIEANNLLKQNDGY